MFPDDRDAVLADCRVAPSSPQAGVSLMRVAIFTDNDFDKISGVTTTLKAVLQHAPSGFSPRVYTASDISVNAPTYFASASWGIGLPWYKDMKIYWPKVTMLMAEMLADDVRLIHVTTPGPVGLAGRWIARRLRLPIVGSFHTHIADYTQAMSGSERLGRLVDTYMRWFYAACEPVLVPSQATADLLTRRGYRPEALKVWSRGVDLDRFTPHRRTASMRDGWDASDHRPAILYAGRLSAEKALALIQPIQAALRGAGIPHRFIFAGDGPFGRTLQSQCPDAVFLGALPHAAVGQVMASADVFLFPSATDAFGNVVLEAQASGLPVLVSDQGGPRQNMVPDATGFVCRAGTATDFVTCLGALLRDPDRRRTMGEAARQYASARSWPESLVPLFSAWRTALTRGDRQAEVPLDFVQTPAQPS
jgi:glycosyltransferase involved in cell wall biosynthesis